MTTTQLCLKMKADIIQALLQYPFRISAEEIASRVLEDDRPPLGDCFMVLETLLTLTREGVVKRLTKDGDAVFLLNIERPTAHSKIKLVNVFVAVAAGAPLYTLIDAAAHEDIVVDPKTFKDWDGIACHIVKRFVVFSTISFIESRIYPPRAWYPWNDSVLDAIQASIEALSITPEYFLEEPRDR